MWRGFFPWSRQVVFGEKKKWDKVTRVEMGCSCISLRIEAGEMVTLSEVGGPCIIRTICCTVSRELESSQDVCAKAYWYQRLSSPLFPFLESYADYLKDLPIIGGQAIK